MLRKNVQVETKHMFPVVSVEDLAEVEKEFKLNYEKNVSIILITEVEV